MEDKIERINTYNDKRFDPEILKQHGAFLVNEKFVCQFQIFQRTCAVVTWEGNIDLEALIKEFRFYAEHVTKFYDRNYHLLREYPAISLFRIPLYRRSLCHILSHNDSPFIFSYFSEKIDRKNPPNGSNILRAAIKLNL